MTQNDDFIDIDIVKIHLLKVFFFFFHPNFEVRDLNSPQNSFSTPA